MSVAMLAYCSASQRVTNQFCNIQRPSAAVANRCAPTLVSTVYFVDYALSRRVVTIQVHRGSNTRRILYLPNFLGHA